MGTKFVFVNIAKLFLCCYGNPRSLHIGTRKLNWQYHQRIADDTVPRKMLIPEYWSNIRLCRILVGCTKRYDNNSEHTHLLQVITRTI